MYTELISGHKQAENDFWELLHVDKILLGDKKKLYQTAMDVLEHDTTLDI